MRIRAVRPDFWQDDTLGHLSDSVRLFYIGLWCVADDAGWLEWKPSQLGAALYPYRNSARRVRDIAVLDPFLGSGTTALAAEMEGFEWIGTHLATDSRGHRYARYVLEEEEQLVAGL